MWVQRICRSRRSNESSRQSAKKRIRWKPDLVLSGAFHTRRHFHYAITCANTSSLWRQLAHTPVMRCNVCIHLLYDVTRMWPVKDRGGRWHRVMLLKWRSLTLFKWRLVCNATEISFLTCRTVTPLPSTINTTLTYMYIHSLHILWKKSLGAKNQFLFFFLLQITEKMLAWIPFFRNYELVCNFWYHEPWDKKIASMSLYPFISPI